MAYGIPEFPAGNMYDSDLRELLAQYRKLTEFYQKTLEEVEDLQNRVTLLEEHIDDVLNEKLESVYDDMKNIISRMDQIDSEMTQLQSWVRSENTALQNTVNAQITQLRQDIAQTDAAMRNYVDQEIDQLQKATDQAISDMRQWTTTYVTGQIAIVNGQIAQLLNDIDDLRRYSDNKDNQLRVYIDDEISRVMQMIIDVTIDQVYVRNPVDGKIVNLQVALDDMWGNLTYWKLTAEEYDTLYLTAEEYDSAYDINLEPKGLTAYEYDYLARWFLKEKYQIISYIDGYKEKIDRLCAECKTWIIDFANRLKKHVESQLHMYSPITGTYGYLKDVIYSMFGLLRRMALTAIAYDSMKLSAETYDNLGATAYQYDWYGLQEFKDSIPVGGITADQYDNLLVDTLGYLFAQ